MTFSLPGRQASKKQKVALGQNCSQKQICLCKHKPIYIVRKWAYTIPNIWTVKDTGLGDYRIRAEKRENVV